MPLACGDDLSWVDCLFVELLLQNFSILADEEIYTARGFVFVNVDAILAGDFFAPVTLQRELHADLVGEGFVVERAVHAPTHKLGVGGVPLFPILLGGFYFVRSTSPHITSIKNP